MSPREVASVALPNGLSVVSRPFSGAKLRVRVRRGKDSRRRRAQRIFSKPARFWGASFTVFGNIFDFYGLEGGRRVGAGGGLSVMNSGPVSLFS